MYPKDEYTNKESGRLVAVADTLWMIENDQIFAMKSGSEFLNRKGYLMFAEKSGLICTCFKYKEICRNEQEIDSFIRM